MEDVILIIAVAAVMVFGFFIMKRLDVFLKENKKAAIIVFEKENRGFTNVLTDYMSRK